MSKKRKDNSSLDWRIVSIVELVVAAGLVVWNDYLGGSANYDDFSPLPFIVILIGIGLQVTSFVRARGTWWGFFALAAVLAHLVIIPYLLFAIGFAGYGY